MSLSADDPAPLTCAAPAVTVDVFEQVVERACAGDEQAFEQLYQRYRLPLYRYLARMVGNDEVGWDLTQDTFLKAWKSRATLKQWPFFGAWLYRIATNLARDHFRRQRAITWLPWMEEYEEDRRDNVEVVGPEDQVEKSVLVRQALMQLSFTHRTCLILHFHEGLTQDEIAKVLRVSERSVRRYLVCAIEAFKQACQQNSLESL